MEKRARVMDKIRTALVYPSLMMLVAFIVLVFLFIFVIPKIAGIFEDTGQSLPLITKVLLAIADNARRFWYLAFNRGSRGLDLWGQVVENGARQKDR